ncbi:MAG: transglycosylase domain-containing protein [Anaerolineae bacterium]|nr:transglycosylase domain-containing protein [Anaerolineae bacterium]
MLTPHLVRMRHHRRERTRKSSVNRFRQWLMIALAVLLSQVAVLVGITATSAATVYNYFLFNSFDLPDPSQITQVEDNFQTTKMFDRNGKLIYEVIDPNAGDRQWVPFRDISPLLACATVAIEDKTFYENPGFDMRGIIRAFVSNLRGDVVQGGSGITQQLVKNVMIAPEERYKQDYGRKIREVILSSEISRRYSKNQILEWYLNTNNYGSLAYGVESASRIYFGKSAKDVTLAEAAMLSAVPQFPRLNPFDNPVLAKDRQELVLDQMLERLQNKQLACSDVTEAQLLAAKNESLRYAKRDGRFNIFAPHFTFYARSAVVDLLADHLRISEQEATDMVYRRGLRIKTSLDFSLEEDVRKIANEKIARLQADKKNANNASVVVMDAVNGELLAMVGSLDYYNDKIDGKFNVATGLRQPGSSFKPITFLEMMRQGLGTPSTLFWDVATTFATGERPPNHAFVPKNYDDKFHGPVRMRTALANSYNIPAVKALQTVGIPSVLRLAHLLGINDLEAGLERYGLSLTLGGGEVKLLDMTYLYSTFANGGAMVGAPRPQILQRRGYRKLDPAVILEITDVNGRQLYKYTPSRLPNMLGPNSPQLTYLLTNMLSDNEARTPAFGVGNVLELKRKRPAAVKTGTTNDNRDNWTIGYTPQYVVGVWVGNTDATPMDKTVTGLTGAAPIWHDVMEMLHTDLSIENFERPTGIVEQYVCAVDGFLPGNTGCPVAKELFIRGLEPSRATSMVESVPYDRLTGRPATVETPPDQIEYRTVYRFPDEAIEWFKAQGKDVRDLFPQLSTRDVIESRNNAGQTSVSVPSGAGSIVPIRPAGTNNAAPGSTLIAFPANGTTVSDVASRGVIPILGSVWGVDFAYYNVAIAPANSSNWQAISPDIGTAIPNGTIATWYSSNYPEGAYNIKVTRYDKNGASAESIIRVNLLHSLQ